MACLWGKVTAERGRFSVALFFAALFQDEVNKRVQLSCVLPCGFLNTYTGETQMFLHVGFMRQTEVQPRALAAPNNYKQFQVLTVWCSRA